MHPHRAQPSRGSAASLRRSVEHVVGLVRWFGVRRILAAVFAVVGALVGGWVLLRASPDSVESQLPRASTTIAAQGVAAPGASGSGNPVEAAPSTSPSTVVVHVAGAVVRPGVVRLAAGARVENAVEAAGGPIVGADLDALNLAAQCVDGSRIYVPRFGEVIDTGTPLESASGPALRVNINTASVADLDALPGIGPSLAQAIVGYRTANGPFRTLEALLAVPGVGPSKLQQLRDLVTV